MKRFLRRRLLLAVAVVIVLGGAGGFIYTRVASGAAVTYRTAAAQLGTVIQSVSLSGNLTPTQESNLDFGSSGKVTAVDVQPGQAVTAGEVLATIDPTLLNAQLAQGQANLASAQAKLALDQAGSSISTDETSVGNAKVSLDDTIASDNLKVSQAEAAVTSAQAAYNADGCAADAAATGCSGPSGAISTLQNDQDNLESTRISDTQAQDQAESQVTSAENALATAEAQQPAQVEEDQAAVEEDQATVQEDQTAVAGATIAAPAAGEVAEVGVTVGESVTGSSNPNSSGTSSASNSGSSSYAIVLITPGDFAVTGTVSDAQVDEIALGQSAYITPAGTTQTYTGSVTEVAPVATISNGVATFPVTVTVSGTHDELKSGMTASVSVTVSRAVGVLTVPTSAVTNSGGATTVRVMDKGVVEIVPVTIGAADSEVTQILSGLSSGEQVVIAEITSTIPSSSASTGTGRTFTGLGGGGGFTGGGGFAGRGGG